MNEELEELEIEFNEIISESFKIDVFHYNSKVRDEFCGVLNIIAENKSAKFNSDIARELSLSESHVELIQYLICNNAHADYGTSPRGCWLTKSGEQIYAKLKELKSQMDQLEGSGAK